MIMNGEISYDLVMEANMDFAEGTFRIANGDWQVFIFRKDAIQQAEDSFGHWHSGAKGVFVRLPNEVHLNKQVIEQKLAEELNVQGWCEVHGPDSMHLR